MAAMLKKTPGNGGEAFVKKVRGGGRGGSQGLGGDCDNDALWEVTLR